jgi:cytochrome c oxidase subunit I+III
VIPEKPKKDIGLDVTVPLYASGAKSVGWWAMFITMIGDMSAFGSLVFGYFFFWTVHEDFPPADAAGPGVFWPVLALGLIAVSWALTLLARRCNFRDQAAGLYGSLGLAAICTLAGAYSMWAGPHFSGLDPTTNVYPATVWVLVLWCLIHLSIGLIMQLYCLARRAAGRMTAVHDIDIRNVALFWHFMLITIGVTVAVIAGFPEVL